MKKALSILSCCLIITIDLFSQCQWQQTSNTINGVVDCMAQSGTEIFAGTYDNGIFLSSDNGLSWAAINNGLNNLTINSLAISGANIFAGTNTGIYLSTDNGANWILQKNGLPYNGSFIAGAITISGNYIIAGVSSGIYLSNDLGLSWKNVSHGLVGGLRTAVFYGSNIIVGEGESIYLSKDTCKTWTELKNGLTGYNSVYSIAVNGTDIFAGTTAGLYKSTNNGLNWSFVNVFGQNYGVSTVIIIGNNILAGSCQGINLSTDYSSNWNTVNEGFTSNICATSYVISGSHIFLGTDKGVWKHYLPLKVSVPLSININSNSDNLCEGSRAVFTSSPTNAGNNPSYQWIVNGIPSGTNSSIFSYIPENGDSVKCKLTSEDSCQTNNPAISNVINVILNNSSNRTLWGITENGGLNYTGVIFKYNPDTKTYSNIWDFNGSYFNQSGSYPQGTLMQASNGMLYGITWNCAPPPPPDYGNGVLFEYNLVNKSYNFIKGFGSSNIKEGAHSSSKLIEGNNSKLYGLSQEGGEYNAGVIFEYDILNKKYSKLFDFDSMTGAHPFGSLLQSTNNRFYGMTNDGGEHKKGILFEFDVLSKTLLYKYPFDSINGANPFGTLIRAINGKLYGMTKAGGINNAGVIFEFDTVSKAISKKYDFIDSTGANPYGSLFQASNDKLYGMTSKGGVNDKGVLFEFDITGNSYSVKLNFRDSLGSNPFGTLMQDGEDKLYGMTSNGGSYGLGVMFEYDFKNNIYNRLVDFTGEEGTNPGAFPRYSELINIAPYTGISVSADTIPLCEGVKVTYTAIATNEGSHPVYQWKVNGIISGANSSIFTYSPANRDTIMCELTSNAACNLKNNFAVSNKIIMKLISPPTSDNVFSLQVKELGESISFDISAKGTPPFSFQWMHSGLNIPGATDSIFSIKYIVCSDSGHYSCKISNMCSSLEYKVAKLFLINCMGPESRIAGFVKYDNADSTLMTNTDVYLFNSKDELIDSMNTGNTGDYVFMNLINDTYKLTCKTSKPWGGINPVDALMVNRNYIGLYNFPDPLKKKAADVSCDNKINPIDGLMINRKYISVIKKYCTDWIFENPTIIQKGNDISKNIRAICRGDVNGSYIPPLRIMSHELGVMNDKTINIEINKPFVIPVYLNDFIILGAIGIKLKFQSSGLKIIDVKSDLPGLIYNISGDNQQSTNDEQLINIAWTSEMDGYEVTPDKPLFVLSGNLVNFTNLTNLTNLINYTSESVLSDIDANLISIDKLLVPKLGLIQNSVFNIQNFPNPFTNNTTIVYTIPEDGNVSIEVYNVIGERVRTLKDEMQNTGVHSLQFDAAVLREGIYYCVLRLENGEFRMSKTSIMMIAR